MRKMAMGALLLAGAMSLELGSAAAAEVTGDSTEVRVFVLEKSGKPVDLSKWTGAIDVTPESGKRKAYKLEPAAPLEAAKEGARIPKEPVKGEETKDPMLCGQVKQLDDWYVELVVLRPSAHREGRGFGHSHGAPCFKATLDDASIQDAKTGVINFSASVVFTLPNGDTKYVKGFEFPEGVIEDVLGRILDKDLKKTSELTPDQSAAAARKIQKVLHALPELSFDSAGDRQEFEKAKQECMAACHRLEQATGKDIGDAADKCKSALKEVRSQAKDAQGALKAE
jgi:hypothetical protein